MKSRCWGFFLALCLIDLSAYAALPLQQLHLPKGFHISVYSNTVKGAREMAVASDGTVYVGTRGQGKVYALLPEKGFAKAKKTVLIATKLNEPNGVAVHDGALYVAEVHRILRYDNIAQHLKHPPKPAVIIKHLPGKRWHGLRVIHFGPKGWLYVTIGMPCNSCLRSDKRFGTVLRMRADGAKESIYASGLRNSMGFDWAPNTDVLWLSDNGQDWLGDNLPPDEINRAPRANMNFGFPYFYGNDVPAPKYGSMTSAQGMTPPAFELPAHVAPLGIRFYQGKMFPKRYHGQLFIAEHGSWNRSKKVGYQVVMASIKNGKVLGVKPFIWGWLQGQRAWGRPVDIAMLPDGSLLVSDDYAGVIYRVIYHANKTGSAPQSRMR